MKEGSDANHGVKNCAPLTEGVSLEEGLPANQEEEPVVDTPVREAEQTRSMS
jgi:hypothetical protein